MAEQNPPQQNQFFISDANTRIRDLEEKNHILKERVLLIGKNLILSKENQDKEIKQLKKQTTEIENKLKEIETINKNILTEINKFAKKDEMRLIERMLKDFQPLEFMRKKDVEELIQNKLKIKTTKPIK